MTSHLRFLRARFRHLKSARGGATSLEYGLIGGLLALALTGVLREIAAEAMPFVVRATANRPEPGP